MQVTLAVLNGHNQPEPDWVYVASKVKIDTGSRRILLSNFVGAPVVANVRDFGCFAYFAGQAGLLGVRSGRGRRGWPQHLHTAPIPPPEAHHILAVYTP